MQTDLNKAKFDPIPVLPPGIAPPMPAESKPASSKSSAPSKPAEAKPVPSAVPTWLKGVFAPTKNKGIVAVAAGSLFAGWYGVKTIFPPAPKYVDVAQSDKTAMPPLPAFETPELLPVVPPVPTGFLPPIVVPVVEVTTATPTAPVTVPPVNLDFLAGTLSPTVKVPPTAANEIKPVGFQDIKIPELPPLPTATGPAPGTAVAPPLIELPGATAATAGPPAIVPVIPVIDLPNLGPAAPPAPPTVVQPTPTPAPPAAIVPELPAPSLPGGSSLVAPDLNFSKPAASMPAATAPTASVTPLAPAPVYTPPSSTIVPVYNPPASTIVADPKLLPVAGGGMVPTPTVETKTDFDVDLHYPKSGETYATIAKQHYGDERYANVLAQFNQSANGGNSRVVQIPPTWWVKKQIGAPSVRPVTAPAPPPSSKADEWAGVASTAGTYRFYTVPATTTGVGMTFRDIARQAYGTDQEWQRVFDLNQSYSSDAVLPVGTRVRLSGDAKVGQ